MARSWMVALLCCVAAAMVCQAALAAEGAVAHTGLGLALPDSIPSQPSQISDQDPFADDEYIMEMERQDREEADAVNAAFLDDMGTPAEQLVKPADVQHNMQDSPNAGFGRLPVPFELSAAQPVMAMASTFSKEVRSAVEQAQAIAAQLMNSQGPMKVFNGIATSSSVKQDAEGAPINVIELESLGGSNAADGFEIDITLTTERTGPTWALPSIFPTNMPTMFGFFGRDGSNKEGAKLAAELTQSVIESALANPDAIQHLADGDELVLDMTVENAQPKTTERLVAAATAAAASAAANAAATKQPWDTLELQMEVVETITPMFKNGRFCVAAILLLSVQVMLCIAIAMLWARAADEDEEDSDDEDESEDEVDLKQQKGQEEQKQGDWAIMAEEGRGLYEKLLSYT